MINLETIYTASTVLSSIVRRTPLMQTDHFNKNCELYFKAENLQLTGSFKIRGAGFKISQLSDEEKAKGVIACSAGNHAQGVALAAQRYGIPAVICLPSGAPISKVEATRSLGAEIRLVDGVYDDAYAEALRLKDELNMSFIHPFDDELVIAGQGTVGLEIIQELPDVDVIFVPIGGGGLASGVALAVKSINPKVKIIGVQAAGAPSMYNSIHNNQRSCLKSINSIADGIAVKKPGKLTFDYCRKYLDDIVTVTEDEICAAILRLIEQRKLIAEGAGAVSVAAAMYEKYPIAGKKVCSIISGGNIDVTILNRVINRGLLKSSRLSDMVIEMPDRPGSLLKLSQIIVNHGANIISAHHERSSNSEDVTSCNLRIGLETRDEKQIKEIINDITERGFCIEQIL